MRGADEQPGSMFSYVSLEERVPPDHPLRAIRRITDRALERLSPRFGTLYVNFGRPSIPPEKLLRALLLQALYTIRSERQLMEQLDYNLLFRWFVGLGMDDAVWSPTTFTKNRDRLLDGDIAAAFFEAVLIHADTARLLSDEHFTVDGTLLEAWASQKSFRPRDEEPPDGRRRQSDRQFSRPAPHERDPSVDDRSRCAAVQEGAGPRGAPRLLGPCADGASVGPDRQTDGHAGRRPRRTRRRARDDRGRARSRIASRSRPTRATTRATSSPTLRAMTATPHVAQHTTGRRSAIDARTTRHAGYAISQRKRKLVEQGFGWMKTIGGLRKLRHRGGPLVTWIFTFTAAAYNIVRLRRLLDPRPYDRRANAHAAPLRLSSSPDRFSPRAITTDRRRAPGGLDMNVTSSAAC